MDDIDTIDAKVNEYGDVTLVMNTEQARDLLALLRNGEILLAPETVSDLDAALSSLPL